MKTLYDGTKVPLDTPTKNTSKGRHLLSTAEKTARAKEEKIYIENKKLNKYKQDRAAAYAAKEATGELPESANANIDEIWQELEYIATTAGVKLSARATSIIKIRKDIKSANPKV